MKISPQVYAKTLVESSSGDRKKIASRFWHILQKNKQYKDLPQILDALDDEAAQSENKKIARIYSKEKLDKKTLDEIKDKLSARLVIPESDGIPTSGIQNIDSRSGGRPVGNDRIILKNIIGQNITGIIVKAGDKMIDLSLEKKVQNLKKLLVK